MIRTFIARVRSFYRGISGRRDLQVEMEEEFRLHMEMRAADLEREGLSPREALRRARLEFGSPAQYQDEASASRGLAGFDRLRVYWLDFRFSARKLKHRPLYTFGLAGTHAIGVAAALVAFSITWRVWLAPMGYPEPDRVVRLYELAPPGPETPSEESRRQRLSPTLLGDLNDHRWQAIEAFSWSWRSEPNAQVDLDGVRSTSSLTLSPEGFTILGLTPLVGRLPLDNREVLISQRYWESRLGGDSSAIGSEVEAGEGLARIVGVARLPSGYPGDVDVVRVIDWEFSEAEDREFRFYEAIALLRPGSTVEEAEAEMNAFMAGLAEVHPVHIGWTIDAVVLSDDLMRPFRGAMALFLAAGTIFLLLASVNVIGIVAARRVEGRQERAIRLALGASERRLLWASLTEGIVLAAMGTVSGIVVAGWLIAPIRSAAPQGIPRLSEVAVTPYLVAAGALVGVLVALGIGVTGYVVSQPVRLSVTRRRVWPILWGSGRRTLVVGQVALTTLLTAGGVAVLHRVTTLRAVDLGYNPEGVTMTSTMADERPYSREEFPSLVLEPLRQGGIDAAMALNTPMTGEDFPRPEMRAAPDDPAIIYDFHLVSENYFSVMEIGMLAGRDFAPTDRPGSQRVAVVSEKFVEDYFGTGTPPDVVIGREIGPLLYESVRPVVVGVVESTRHHSPELPVEPQIYAPLSQSALPIYTLVIRGEPEDVAGLVGPVLAQVDPELEWTPMVPYTSLLSEWYAPLRLQTTITSLLGALGLLLSSLGLYAFLAYQVASRRREFGIRKAIGSTERRLMLDVLARGSGAVLLGGGLGLLAWYAFQPWSRGLFEGTDGGGYLLPLAVIAIVGGACMLAMLVPARQAARVDPAAMLKTI